MREECRDKWEALAAYAFDEPGSAETFAQRLAREQGWRRRFAERVVEEYRRFAFLAAVAGHPVSPSDSVDQAWHLHLLYTRRYWNDFCPLVLGMNLHHQPSLGGEAEHRKHRTWYEQTLTSYRRIFGEEPPADIWPPVDTPVAHRYQRIDVAQNVVLPRRGVLQVMIAVLGGLAVLMLLSGCAVLPVDRPLDMQGPNFLRFYIALAVTGLVAAAMVRRGLRVPWDHNDEADDLDVDHVAMMNGGHDLAVNVAIMRMVDMGVVDLRGGGATVKLLRQDMPSGLSRLDRAICDSLLDSGEAALHVVRRRAEPELAAMEDELVARGLVVGPAQRWGAQLLPWGLALAPAVMGASKIVVGVTRGRPVLYLVLLVVLSVFVAMAMFRRPVFRTRRGDKALRRLQKKYKALSKGVGLASAGVDTMVLATAVFGLSVLHATSHARLVALMTPMPREKGGWWGGGCGAGGGCGGGGCGGCGGCGGG